MTNINFEKIVKADCEKVFDIVSDYEKFEKTLPQYFPSIRVRSKRGNTAIVEEHVRLAGREMIMMTKHVAKYPELHEVFVIGGNAKGSHIIERFESIPEGTKISVEIDLKLKGALKIIGMFGKNKIQDSFTKIMDEFAKVAEKK